MSIGLVGRKIGMTRIFTDDGASVPVTVLDVSDNRVTQIKIPATDGYSAVQITCGTRRTHRVSKPLIGHFAKAGVEAGRMLKEFVASADEIGDLKPGDALTLGRFQVGQKVDISGSSQGKGFSGVIKRHNFRSNRASHGNSITTRAPGSIGQAQDPGRVFPGKKMAGHYGAAKITTQNLEIIRIDMERHLLLIKGAVPGSKGNDVIIRPSVKAGA